MAPSSTSLLALIHDTKRRLAALPVFDFYDQAPYRAAVTQLRADLETLGATFGDHLSGQTITYGGVRASSTSGEVGAITNWIKAAYRKLDRRSLAEA